MPPERSLLFRNIAGTRPQICSQFRDAGSASGTRGERTPLARGLPFAALARGLGQPGVADLAVRTLEASSAGAVLFGAVTDPGNGPNFLAKSIAESRGMKMPSFFVYMLRAGREISRLSPREGRPYISRRVERRRR